ncbi:RDD family protein [compost metagenome]
MNDTNNLYAGFWARGIAFTIDIVFISSIMYLIYDALLYNLINENIRYFIKLLTIILYFFCFTLLGGQTLGKMLIGIKVISSSKSPLKWEHILLRELIGKFIVIIIPLVAIIIGLHPKKLSLHDRMAGTYVIWELRKDG